MTSIKRVAIVILSSLTGTAVGYPVFLFLGIVVISLYGDNARPPELLQSFVFYGVFGSTTLIGFAVGLYLTRKKEGQVR